MQELARLLSSITGFGPVGMLIGTALMLGAGFLTGKAVVLLVVWGFKTNKRLDKIEDDLKYGKHCRR